MIPLYEYDGFLQVDEGYRPGNGEHTIADYLFGHCHTLALVMGQQLGLTIAAIIQPEPLDMDKPCLVHAFCLHPTESTLIVDAKGVSSLADVYDTYGESPDHSDFVSGDFNTMKEVLAEVLSMQPLPSEDENAVILDYVETLEKLDFLTALA